MQEKKFITKSSGKKIEFETGSQRDSNDGRGRFDLIPYLPLERLAQLYERGANKYGENNWKKGQPLWRYLNSAMRHLVQVIEGINKEEDHASAVAFNIFGYIWTKDQIEKGNLPKELARELELEDIQIKKPKAKKSKK